MERKKVKMFINPRLHVYKFLNFKQMVLVSLVNKKEAENHVFSSAITRERRSVEIKQVTQDIVKIWLNQEYLTVKPAFAAVVLRLTNDHVDLGRFWNDFDKSAFSLLDCALSKNIHRPTVKVEMPLKMSAPHPNEKEVFTVQAVKADTSSPLLELDNLKELFQ